jgi:hypothetical protein
MLHRWDMRWSALGRIDSAVIGRIGFRRAGGSFAGRGNIWVRSGDCLFRRRRAGTDARRGRRGDRRWARGVRPAAGRRARAAPAASPPAVGAGAPAAEGEGVADWTPTARGGRSKKCSLPVPQLASNTTPPIPVWHSPNGAKKLRFHATVPMARSSAQNCSLPGLLCRSALEADLAQLPSSHAESPRRNSLSLLRVSASGRARP